MVLPDVLLLDFMVLLDGVEMPAMVWTSCFDFRPITVTPILSRHPFKDQFATGIHHCCHHVPSPSRLWIVIDKPLFTPDSRHCLGFFQGLRHWHTSMMKKFFQIFPYRTTCKTGLSTFYLIAFYLILSAIAFILASNVHGLILGPLLLRPQTYNLRISLICCWNMRMTPTWLSLRAILILCRSNWMAFHDGPLIIISLSMCQSLIIVVRLTSIFFQD